VLSGVLAQGATNPVAAEGGADGETVDGVRRRGPLVLRHRRQAIALDDYEALAREASPAVAVARALPATHPTGRPLPGWVRVLIVPASSEAEPRPSFQLRRHVLEFLSARSPASMAGQISIGAPRYFPIGVEAEVAPLDPGSAGPVLDAVRRRLAEFLHPLSGGPDGEGWPFGRDAFVSDFAAVLESVDGVDHVETLTLVTDGTPRGERVDVPGDRIVVAGQLRLTLTGAGG
jgi:predicted phage baseplate assembly protein